MLKDSAWCKAYVKALTAKVHHERKCTPWSRKQSSCSVKLPCLPVAWQCTKNPPWLRFLEEAVLGTLSRQSLSWPMIRCTVQVDLKNAAHIRLFAVISRSASGFCDQGVEVDSETVLPAAWLFKGRLMGVALKLFGLTPITGWRPPWVF